MTFGKLLYDPEYSNEPSHIYVAEIDSDVYKLGYAKDLAARKSQRKYDNYLWSKPVKSRAVAASIENAAVIQTYFARTNQEKTNRPRGHLNEHRFNSMLPWQKAVEHFLWNEEMVALYGWHPWMVFYNEAKSWDDSWIPKPYFLMPLGFQ